jgi:hypothetical protein
MNKPYDILVIELQKEGKSLGSISITHEDLDMMIYHEGKLEKILLDMYLQLEDGAKKRNNSDEKDSSIN